MTLYEFAYIVSKMIFSIVTFRTPLKAYGKENIPAGGAVICSNHVHNSDPFYIVYSFHRKDKIWIMAKEEIRHYPVVGRLLKVERHPTVEKYFVCQVDVGGGRVLQQVTAATNLVEGGLCPVCLPGGHVKGGAPIGEAEFDGVKSSGMLCSLPELGLSQNDFPYGIENGIFFIEEPCRPGDDIRPVLGLDDTVYDVEITANRPDGHSVIGVAREVSAAFGKPFKGHKPQVKGGCTGRQCDHVSVFFKIVC
mgnify:CR=1 FL=1